MSLRRLPMLTGHNCFGAVLMPITMADFISADVSDSHLDGCIAGFPNSHATKLGKTSDIMYKLCFVAFMTTLCSSIFPRCTVPQSRDESVPFGGRVPMCFTNCISTLVMCPGYAGTGYGVVITILTAASRALGSFYLHLSVCAVSTGLGSGSGLPTLLALA